MKMEGPIQEKDWKYMRSIRDALLHTLCWHINEKAKEIIESKAGNAHERYLELFRHIQDSDDIVASCFNDWRRSNINLKILCLRREGLLTDEHVQNFSDGAKDWLSKVEAMENT